MVVSCRVDYRNAAAEVVRSAEEFCIPPRAVRDVKAHTLGCALLSSLERAAFGMPLDQWLHTCAAPFLNLLIGADRAAFINSLIRMLKHWVRRPHGFTSGSTGPKTIWAHVEFCNLHQAARLVAQVREYRSMTKHFRALCKQMGNTRDRGKFQIYKD